MEEDIIIQKEDLMHEREEAKETKANLVVDIVSLFSNRNTGYK